METQIDVADNQITRIRDLPTTFASERRVMGLLVGITARDRATKPTIVHISDFSQYPGSKGGLKTTVWEEPVFRDEDSYLVTDVEFPYEPMAELKEIIGDVVDPESFQNNVPNTYPLYDKGIVVSFKVIGRQFKDTVKLVVEPAYDDEENNQQWLINLDQARENVHVQSLYNQETVNYAVATEIFCDWIKYFGKAVLSYPSFKNVIPARLLEPAPIKPQPLSHDGDELKESSFLSDLESSEESELEKEENSHSDHQKQVNVYRPTIPVDQIPVEGYDGAYFVHVKVISIESRSEDLFYKNIGANTISTKSVDIVVKDFETAATLRVRVEKEDLLRFVGTTFINPQLKLTVTESEAAKNLIAMVNDPVRMLVKPKRVRLAGSMQNYTEYLQWLYSEV
ncbi:hypothetical protein OGAPHI_007262 [Ogataea philodendri]|uniref:Uncharacterized protein n=1 Tax=Ogataea philodendri TaxID=1378263 RepID=A0A9P8NVL5_9ASCO|nr:uncharacterized protein OGAPHI_007262 [Ogataea philodendri]KAH3660057.1 hypothetical protein OGAPHI_007262 [Ogataea philodendri]